MPVRRFKKGQRIVVVSAESHLVGRTGTVRLPLEGGSAWAHMDGAPPSEFVILYPDECAVEPALQRQG